jgi:nucleoside-diphosphate-sugar epimerase
MTSELAGQLVLAGGATGNQGSAVARELLERGFRVRALTRDPGRPAARDLAARATGLRREHPGLLTLERFLRTGGWGEGSR